MKKETKQNFTVRLSDAELKFLAKIAKSEKASIGDVIRFLIKFYKESVGKK
jgi:hypothetical protein